MKKYSTTDLNFNFMEKYIKDDKGLFLLSSPTGSGKTHAIIQYIIKHFEEEKKFIYVIPNITNLDDFQAKLLKELSQEQRKKVLKIHNLNKELELWRDEKANKNYDYLESFESFKELKRKLFNLKKIQKFKEDYKELIQDKESKIRKLANLLIKEVKQSLKKEKGESAESLRKEILELFPYLDLKDYKIILLTTSKLAYKIQQFSSAKYLWELCKYPCIFLDEFDSQHEYLLDAILSQQKNKNIDLLELFRIISKTFLKAEFNHKLNYNEEKFMKFKERIKNIDEKYKLKYYFDSNLLKENSSLPILFDASFGAWNLQEDSKELYIKIDEKAQHLLITKEKTDFNFYALLQDIKNLITSYIFLVQNSLFLSKDENAILAQIKDNIKIFDLSEKDEKYNYLFTKIQENIFSEKKSKKSSASLSFYEKDLSLINMKKTYLSNLVNFEFYTLDNNPEKILLSMIKKAFVVGISATANIETVIKNFSLEYLNSKVKILKLNPEEVKEIQESYSINKRQKNRKFFIEFIDNRAQDKKLPLEEFCKKIMKNYLNFFKRIEEKEIDNFTLRKYMNFIDIYRKYLLED